MNKQEINNFIQKETEGEKYHEIKWALNNGLIRKALDIAQKDFSSGDFLKLPEFQEAIQKCLIVQLSDPLKFSYELYAIFDLALPLSEEFIMSPEAQASAENALKIIVAERDHDLLAVEIIKTFHLSPECFLLRINEELSKMIAAADRPKLFDSVNILISVLKKMENSEVITKNIKEIGLKSINFFLSNGYLFEVGRVAELCSLSADIIAQKNKDALTILSNNIKKLSAMQMNDEFLQASKKEIDIIINLLKIVIKAQVGSDILANNGNALEGIEKLVTKHEPLAGDRPSQKEIQDIYNILSLPDVQATVFRAAELGIKLIDDPESEKTMKVSDFPYKSLLKVILKTYGLNGESCLNAWSKCYTGKIGDDNPTLIYEQPQFCRNIMQIKKIASRNAEAPKLLQQQFGIRNFERYNADLLLTQVEQIKDQDKPYGIILLPTADWNGAFAHMQFTFLAKQLGGRCNLRFMEANSKWEVAKRLITMDKFYGRKNKISFMVIGGHGRQNSIFFGGKKPLNELTTKELSGSGSIKAKNYFVPHPTFILHSCSTGAKGGFAENLARTFKAKVIAPPNLTFAFEAIYKNLTIDDNLSIDLSDTPLNFQIFDNRE